MNPHNNSRGNSHRRDRHSSNGYQDRGRYRYPHEENSHHAHRHGRSHSEEFGGGGRGRYSSNNAQGFSQDRGHSGNRYEHHRAHRHDRSRSRDRQENSYHRNGVPHQLVEEGRMTTVQHHGYYASTTMSNMQLHSNEMQLPSPNAQQRDHCVSQSSWNGLQHHHSNDRCESQSSWNGRQQQQQQHRNDQLPWHAPPSRAQLSFHDHRYNSVSQQRPYARPRYDQFQSYRPYRPEVRFENYFSANKLVQTAMQNLLFLDPFLLSVFWNKLSKRVGEMQAGDDYSRDNGEMERNLAQIFDLTRRKIASSKSRVLSVTIHGIAKIASVVKGGGSTRNGNCVETAFRSLLLDNSVHHGLFDTMANHIVALENLTGFTSQSLANIVWAFAKVELSQPGLFSKIAEHIVELPTLNGFVPQDIANTVWAFATAGIAHEALFDKIAHHIVELGSLNEFKPQHLSITVWAFTTAGIAHEALFDKISVHIIHLPTLDEFKPQDISNTLWAFANADIPHHPQLFDRIGDHIVANTSIY